MSGQKRRRAPLLFSQAHAPETIDWMRAIPTIELSLASSPGRCLVMRANGARGLGAYCLAAQHRTLYKITQDFVANLNAR